MAALGQRPRTRLLDWAKPLWLATASGLTWAYVMTVPAAVRRLHVRKCRAVTYFVEVDSVPDASTELCRIGQDTRYGARSDVHNVIVEPASVREASLVTSQETKAFLTTRGRWRNAGIQSEQICDRTRILRAASRTDRSHVSDERQQVGARR